MVGQGRRITGIRGLDRPEAAHPVPAPLAGVRPVVAPPVCAHRFIDRPRVDDRLNRA